MTGAQPKEGQSMKSLRMVTTMAAVFGVMCSARPVFAHEEGACKADVQKFCGDVKPGGGAIKDCMKAHQADLSQGCKDNMAEGKQKMEEKMQAIKQACGADLKQYCANVTPGEGREFACLHSYSDKISAGCKAALPKRGMHHGDKDHKGGDKDDHDGDEPQEGAPAGK
jgi:hypothetical protein